MRIAGDILRPMLEIIDTNRNRRKIFLKLNTAITVIIGFFIIRAFMLLFD